MRLSEVKPPVLEPAGPGRDGPWVRVANWSRSDWQDTGWFHPDHLDGLLALHQVDGLGPKRLVAALTHLGTPGAVWEAPAAALADVPGWSPRVAKALAAARRQVDPGRQADRLAAASIRTTSIADPAYPDRLRHIADPPLLLFHKGPLPDWSRTVAVVGTRRSSLYGETQARRLGRDLAAAGVLVLSGLARGIDAAAHTGALEAGGATAAVLGCSPDIVYPQQNQGLYGRILAEGGSVVSEYPLSTPPLAWRFPARNRLVAGIAHAVVVAEAPFRSGACITATLAADGGTEVMALPGPVDSERFAGSHRLLREGATFVRHAADVLTDLGWLEPVGDEAGGAHGQLSLSLAAATMSKTELAVWQALSGAGDYPDTLASRLGLPVPDVSAALTRLQLKDLVVRQPGPTYHRL